MKKMWKRIAATAMSVCMAVGFATTAGAYQWSYDEGSQGEMVQYVYDDENGNSAPFIVQLVAVGTEVKFSEPVDVFIYSEENYGSYVPVPVTKGVTSYVIGDALNTYVFDGADGGRALFRGTTGQQAPVTFIGDIEYGSTTMKLSKPVVDITIEQLDGYNYATSSVEKYYYLVYEVPVGTKVEAKFGSPYLLLLDIWDAEGKQISDEEFAQVSAQHFPDAPVSDMTGGAEPPLTLNNAGYYYRIVPEALACYIPVIKVVDEQPAAYEQRVSNFTDMNWSKPFVDKVYGYGWMEGSGNGKFEPDGNLTIAQAITLAARLYSAQINEPIPTVQGAWYQTYVDYCLKNHLLNNYYSEYIEGEVWLKEQMEKPASRLDMVKILGGAVDVPGLSWSDKETITIPDLNKDEVNGADLVYDWYRNGILSGDSGTGAFRPNDKISRGEVAVILCNLLGL